MKQGLRLYIATTLPNVIPSLIFGAFNEGVIGLDPLHLIISRLLAIVYRLAFSEWFYKMVGRVLIKFHHKDGQPVKYLLINGLCSVLFWIGLYVFNLVVIGVHFDKIVKVIVLPIIGAFMAGTPVRWLTDQFIKLFNVPKEAILAFFIDIMFFL